MKICSPQVLLPLAAGIGGAIPFIGVGGIIVTKFSKNAAAITPEMIQLTLKVSGICFAGAIGIVGLSYILENSLKCRNTKNLTRNTGIACLLIPLSLTLIMMEKCCKGRVA
jgi:hypothetical protein